MQIYLRRGLLPIKSYTDGKNPPERGTFFYERQGISPVELYEMVRKSVILGMWKGYRFSIKIIRKG